VKKKGAGRPNRHGGASNKAQKPQTNSSKGFSRKGESESFRDGTLGDTVLAPREPAMEHPRFAYKIYHPVQFYCYCVFFLACKTLSKC